MMYNFFVVGQFRQELTATALSEILHVPLAEVEVADADGDPDARNWDALVSCEYSPAKGDVSWVLDIYAQDSVTNQPSEAALVAALSERTRDVMLYRAEEAQPSAYWLVTPDGLVTRARLVESGDDEPSYDLDTVEAYVPQLPSARVARIPEVVREWRTALPVTESFKAAVENLRDSSATSAPSALTDETGSPFWNAWTRLGAWEKLVLRIEAAWLPYGWYPADFYREDLGWRDELARCAHPLPEPAASQFTQALEGLDRRFEQLTTDDRGRGLSEALGTPVENLGTQWWWGRRPEPVPWTAA